MKNDQAEASPTRDKTFAVGIRSGVFGIISNVLLFVAKMTVGILIRSIAVVADAFNNPGNRCLREPSVTGLTLQNVTFIVMHQSLI